MARPVAIDIIARDKASKTFGHVAGSAEGSAKRLKQANNGVVGSFGHVLKRVALVTAAYASIEKATGFVKDSIAEARESQKVGAQTNAVIKATGQAAKVTAGHVGDLATAISNKTGIDDEAIQSGANMLLTFKNIRNEAGKGNKIFDQSTQILTDMSVAMGTDQKSSAIQLGKALNDPIKGITALTRVGVTFSDGQKKQIKSLVEHGKTLDAQKVILKELNSEFGGSAAAQATAGEKMATTWANFKESIGTALLPVLDKVESYIAEKIIPSLSRFAGWLQTNVPVAIAAARTAIQPFLDKIREMAPVVLAFAKQFAAQGWATVKALFQALAPLAASLAQTLKDQVLPVVLQVGGILARNLIPALGVAAKWISRHKTLVQTLAVGLGAMFVAYKAYIAYTKAAAIAQKLLNIVMSSNPIGLLVLALVGLAAGLIYAYKHSETFRKIVNAAFRAVKAVGAGVVNFFAKTLPGAFTKAYNAVRNFFGSTLPHFITGTVWPFVKKWGVLIASAIFPALLIPGLIIAFWGPIKRFFMSIGGRIKGFFKSAGSWLLDAGKRIGSGFKNGVVAGLNGIKGFFMKPINWIIDHVINRFIDLINKLPGVSIDRLGTLGGSDNGSGGGGGNVATPGSSMRAHGGFAKGGRPRFGQTFWVGERGPELMRYGADGVRVWSHSQSKSMAGRPGNGMPGAFLGVHIPKAITSAAKGAVGLAKDGLMAPAKFGKWALDKGAQAAINGAKSLINTVISHAPIPGMFKGLAHGVVDAMGLGIKDKVAAGKRHLDASGTSNVDYKPGSGVSQWSSTVLKALKLVGQPASLLNTVLRRMNQESGGNPNIFNNWDSNARAGTPSGGLMQTIMPTFMAYRLKSLSSNMLDPLANIVASMRYALARYGSLPAAYNKAGGYASGTNNASAGVHLVGEKGPELLLFKGGEKVLNNKQTRSLVSSAQGYASSFREKLPANAMKFQVQQVANVIKEQIGKAFKGDKAAFLYQWIDKAADSAIGKIPGRMAEVGKGLINHTIAYIDGGNQLDKLGERFGRIYQAVRDNFAGPRERAVLGRVRDFNGKLSSLARQRDRIKNQLAQAAEFSAGVASGAKDYANITNLTVSTPKSLITELEKKVKNIGSFNYNLRALSKRGLSTDLLNQLIAAGPEAGGALAQKLMKSGKGQINRLNYLQGRINRNSVALGSTATNIQFGGSARSNFVGTKQQQERALEKAMDKLADRLAASIADSFGDAELRLSESSGRVLARIVSKQAVKDRRR